MKCDCGGKLEMMSLEAFAHGVAALSKQMGEPELDLSTYMLAAIAMPRPYVCDQCSQKQSMYGVLGKKLLQVERLTDTPASMLDYASVR